MQHNQLDSPGGEMLKPSSGSHSYADTHSPVTVIDTVGAVFLGLISLILMIALLRTHARNRQLEVQLARQSREHA
jgi:hypothetical protein